MGSSSRGAAGRRIMGALLLEPPMTRQRRRKCRHCGQLYEPDPRNRRHQRYCSRLACRQASKAASQRRWRASPKGRDYFRGTANCYRVALWRKAHPGYWRRQRNSPPNDAGALQDDCAPQPSAPPTDTPTLNANAGALQDDCAPQVIVTPIDKPNLGAGAEALQNLVATQQLILIGLVAQLTGSALQENIAQAIQQLIPVFDSCWPF